LSALWSLGDRSENARGRCGVAPARLHLEGIELDFIAPGRPMENGFIESLNGKLRMSVSACTGSRALVKTNG